MKDESQARFKSRLEAFSDIVIGFSLAQLGISLSVPSNAEALVADPSWFFGFAFTFAIVCGMWINHHRLFSRHFVPKPLPVVLNFVWLAVVVLVVYANQLQFRLGSDRIVLALYFGCYALAQGLIGVQYLLSLHYWTDPAEASRRSAAWRSATYTFLWTLPFIACFTMVIAIPTDTRIGTFIFATFALTFAATFAVRSRFRRLESQLA